MNDKLILRGLTSPYGDTTKASVLTHNDVDSNFVFLKGLTITTATTDGSIISLTKLNGDVIIVPGSGVGDTYWVSGSTGLFNIKAKNDSGLDATGNYAVVEGYNSTAIPTEEDCRGCNDVQQRPIRQLICSKQTYPCTNNFDTDTIVKTILGQL